jgi:hypothetical protein
MIARLRRAKETVSDIGELVTACAVATFMLSTTPVGLYCTIADVVDQVNYQNSHGQINPNRPSPNVIDFPNGPKNRLKTYEKFCRKYILEKFF